MAQQYSDPYGHTRPEIQHGYSEDSNASGKDQYVGNNDQARPYSQANYPIPQERMSSYDSLPEKSFARPPKAEADGTVRRSRFVGMAANGERPASQWTQGVDVPPKATGWLREWRKENRASWGKGGGWRTFGRFFSCCILSTLFVLISVVLTIAMWVRPPDIRLFDIDIPSSNAVSITTSSLALNFSLIIGVTNPNWFSADFKEISAVAKWPGLDADFGGGSLTDIKFGGNSATNFSFPFMVNYSTDLDPQSIVLSSLLEKCGSVPPGDITIDYDLTLKLHIVAFDVSPTISSSASLQCPVSAADIRKIAGATKRDNLPLLLDAE
ncbi:hypothetical protein FFLO_02382 [Filobasidium floriforme]|uniref:Late embryogenesis abundant protein LEA-2 subgroup domain-containing protein n=1 Tax=Filobasidium floriforme TaxID=5210 RepID=A0A8K0JP19_9TREE|nr:hypothetical protein FFLO_02382 [Filobasidium floriforme]